MVWVPLLTTLPPGPVPVLSGRVEVAESAVVNVNYRSNI